MHAQADLDQTDLANEHAAAAESIAGADEQPPRPITLDASTFVKQVPGPNEVNHMNTKPDEKVQNNEPSTHEDEEDDEHGDDQHHPVQAASTAPTEALGGEEAVAEMALTLVIVLSAACRRTERGDNGKDGETNEQRMDIDFGAAHGALCGLSALLHVSPEVLTTAQLLEGNVSASSVALVPLLCSILAHQRQKEVDGTQNTDGLTVQQTKLETIRVLGQLIAAARECKCGDSELLSAVRRQLMLCGVTEALTKLLLHGYATNRAHRTGGLLQTDKSSAGTATMAARDFKAGGALPKDATRSGDGSGDAVEASVGVGEDEAVASEFLAASINTLAALVAGGHSGSMGRMVLVAGERLGALLVSE
jgi:hypothetical protein